MGGRSSFLRVALLTFSLGFYFVSCCVGFVEGGYSNATKRKRVPVRHQLSLDFYANTCPHVDQLVASVTARRFRDSPASGAATIRLFFHDCFVEGCDASILIAPTTGGKVVVERDVEDNKNLAPEAFETVELAKALVESKCPGMVTCADILAMAARDFVHLAGGPNYGVKKGRKDSRVSMAGKVRGNVPRANSTVDELIRLFAAKGLRTEDLVALSGAHTIGFSHCDQFVNRLYDFRGTGEPDPSIDLRLLKALRMSCPRSGGNNDVVAPFDVQTPFSFDHMYYGNLEAKMGLLATDQALFLDPRTRPLVQGLGRDKVGFFDAFAAGMEKMGSIRVKKGKTGEIRKHEWLNTFEEQDLWTPDISMAGFSSAPFLQYALDRALCAETYPLPLPSHKQLTFVAIII
ncbi:Peroxidase [Musa troglodytarum]|uniref:Peroxidase n=1 Tax=Musa troglodytarum TaxID=320322 RepID=A0A9E7ECY0_9LILI|nr:Peroxidase [Musa troglodytarum]